MSKHRASNSREMCGMGHAAMSNLLVLFFKQLNFTSKIQTSFIRHLLYLHQTELPFQGEPLHVVTCQLSTRLYFSRGCTSIIFFCRFTRGFSKSKITGFCSSSKGLKGEIARSISPSSLGSTLDHGIGSSCFFPFLFFAESAKSLVVAPN